jgi:hypothetical protein
MEKAKNKSILPFIVACYLSPLLFLLIYSHKDNLATQIEWSAKYRILILLLSALAIITFYLTEKKLLSGLKAAESKGKTLSTFARPTEQIILIIGFSYSLFPAIIGIFLAMGFSLPALDFYILIAITYLAMIVWTVRWFRLYSKVQKYPNYDNRFAGQLSLLNETNRLFLQLAILLQVHNDKDQYFPIARKFYLLATDISKTILLCLKNGQIASAIVLLRWYLEIVHLCYFLWQNTKRRNDWLAGEKIEPREIREFIKSFGHADWKETYSDWSNFVHGNAPFIMNYNGSHNYGGNKEGNDIFYGKVFVNILFMTHKLNHIFGKALQPYIAEYYKNIVLQYNQIEDGIMRLSEAQNENEEKYMSS